MTARTAHKWAVEVRTRSGGTRVRYVSSSLPVTARQAERHVRESLKSGESFVRVLAAA